VTKALAALLIGVGSFSTVPVGDPPGTSFRAFPPWSYWNKPLPVEVQVDPESKAMTSSLERDSSYPYVRLAGTESTGGWGEPIYWAAPTDPVYNVKTTRYELPDEFKSLRIPLGAQPAATADAQMTVYDLVAGGVYKLWQARYHPATETWSAGGGAYYYLASNGLHGSLDEADQPRNTGHRGIPPSLHAVRFDEIRAGTIDHVLKISINNPSRDHVWPMIG
jgi:hypothetical protein